MNIFSLFLSGLLLSSVAFAGTVYRWTDEEGRVFFSDKPPGEQPVEDTGITIDIPTSNPDISKDYSIMKQMEYFDQQREKWQAERDKLIAARHEKRRAEQEKAQAAAAGQAVAVPPIVAIPRYYYPAYPRTAYVYPQPRYNIQYSHTGDNHRFDLRYGNTPGSRHAYPNPAVQPYGSAHRPFRQSYGLNHFKY